MNVIVKFALTYLVQLLEDRPTVAHESNWLLRLPLFLVDTFSATCHAELTHVRLNTRHPGIIDKLIVLALFSKYRAPRVFIQPVPATSHLCPVEFASELHMSNRLS